MKTRRPVPALTCRPLPRIDRLFAGVALGTVALAGCKNPFDMSEQTSTSATQQAGFDPTAGLVSIFATTSIAAQAEPHPTYPLLAVAAMQTSLLTRAGLGSTPPAPPTTVTTTGYPPGIMTAGSRAITTPRPPPLTHVRGGVRRVRP